VLLLARHERGQARKGWRGPRSCARGRSRPPLGPARSRCYARPPVLLSHARRA
jgi:hypothetical protein